MNSATRSRTIGALLLALLCASTACADVITPKVATLLRSDSTSDVVKGLHELIDMRSRDWTNFRLTDSDVELLAPLLQDFRPVDLLDLPVAVKAMSVLTPHPPTGRAPAYTNRILPAVIRMLCRPEGQFAAGSEASRFLWVNVSIETINAYAASLTSADRVALAEKFSPVFSRTIADLDLWGESARVLSAFGADAGPSAPALRPLLSSLQSQFDRARLAGADTPYNGYANALLAYGKAVLANVDSDYQFGSPGHAKVMREAQHELKSLGPIRLQLPR